MHFDHQYSKKVRLPGLIGTITPGFVIVLVAMAKLDWAGTVAVGCLCGLVQTMWRAKTRPTAAQVLFNVAVMAISSAVAHAASARLGQADLAVGLGVAGITLLATNTLLVSGALCLMRRAAFNEVRRNVQFWSLPDYLAGGVVASLWVRAEWAGSLWIPAFVAASVYLMDLFYREFIRRADRST